MDLNFLFLFSYFGKCYIYHKRDSENPYIDKMNQPLSNATPWDGYELCYLYGCLQQVGTRGTLGA